MIDIKSLTRLELKNTLIENGEKEFRAIQLFNWIYVKRISDFALMTNILKDSRKKLKELFEIKKDKIIGIYKSELTLKFSIELHDKNIVETVLMNYEDRDTICISTQVGCPLKCTFCATGQMGYVRNLSVSEIINQILIVSVKVGSKPRNVVFMGMGEPLLNYDNLVKAIEIISDSKGLDFSQRRITVSTIGIVGKLKTLVEKFPRLGIAISLSFINEKKRRKFMPFSMNYPLEEIRKFALEYQNRMKHLITFEYVMFSEQNTSEKDAKKLIDFLKGIRCKINLIPFNPIPKSELKKPTNDQVEKFISLLMKSNKTITLREERGLDIYAGCGQLANLNNTRMKKEE